MTIPAPWCSAGSWPGRQEKLGSSESARFIRNTPDALRHDAIRARKSAGRTAGSISRPNVSLGCRLDTTARAENRSPASVTTSATRPFRVTISATPVRNRISTPRSAQARAIASVIAPMPPIAWPQAPLRPFASPKQWWSST